MELKILFGNFGIDFWHPNFTNFNHKDKDELFEKLNKWIEMRYPKQQRSTVGGYRVKWEQYEWIINYRKIGDIKWGKQVQYC